MFPHTLSLSLALSVSDVFVTYGDVTVVEEDGTAQLPVFLVMRETGQSLCVHNRYMTQREVQVSYFTADGTARGEGLRVALLLVRM